MTDLLNLYKEIRMRRPELIIISKSKPAITGSKSLKTLTVESEKLKILLSIKRKAKLDDITLKKKAKLIILSIVNKILISRFSFINDGSEDNKKNDISEAIKDYLIFIGVIINDPDPKRLIFVTIDENGDLKNTIFAIDKYLRLFVLTSSHEQFYKTGESVTYITERESEDTHLRAVLSVSISQVKGLREKPRCV
jgi:hypothetical protein